ncbi:hypothetical protein [Mycobacterium sp. SMC-11]|uniref:hypothetical protein n=1 Tax=Mycobacterium sp. SMC-11 TaxID=3385969 RepID=UPI00390C9E6C
MAQRARVRTALAATAAALMALSGCGSGSTPSGKESAAPPTGSAANPYLSAAKYGITHIDSAQSDSFDDPIPRGTFHLDPTQLARVPGGPVNIITLASTDPSHRWVSSSSGVRYVDVADGEFKQVAALDAPGVQPISTQQLDAVLNQTFTDVGQIESAIRDHWAGANWQRISNGVYSLVDRDNFVYYVTQQSEIIKFALKNAERPEDGITIASRIDFKPYLTGNITSLGIPENIVGTSMTYDGHLLVLSTGSLSVVDRDLSAPLQQIKFGDDETVSNSMAVDQDNGIYVASDKLMRKIVWTGSKLSEAEADGAWSSPYDTGRQPPTIKFGTGTGSTPTLMGFAKGDDELVVITDGADHMKLVAFWRNKIPEGFRQKPGTKSNRIADQIGVTAGLPEPLPEFIQSEQSVVVNGYGAFVVNNIGAGGTPDRLVDVLASGPVAPPPHGVQRFEWDPTAHQWKPTWARGDVVSTSMVPAVSATSGIVFLNGYTKADGWEVTGLDWQTGETVHRTIFGQSNLGNGAYALIEGLPNGDLLFNSVGGPLRATTAK